MPFMIFDFHLIFYVLFINIKSILFVWHTLFISERGDPCSAFVLPSHCSLLPWVELARAKYQ